MLHTIGYAGQVVMNKHRWAFETVGFAILVFSNLISVKGSLRKIKPHLGIAISPFIIIFNIGDTHHSGTEMRLWVCVPNKVGSNPGCSAVVKEGHVCESGCAGRLATAHALSPVDAVESNTDSVAA
jgi:hypothetical protein